VAGVVLVLVTVCGYTDYQERKIRNSSTYPAIAIALAVNAFSSFLPESVRGSLGAIGFIPSLVGFAVCFGTKFLVYCIAKGGAGDVKLAAAIGAFMGAEQGLTVICYTYILAGVAALCIVIWTLGPVYLLRAGGKYFLSLLLPGAFLAERDDPDRSLQRTLPLGVFFALATPLVMFDVDLAELIR
jgi:Flp pilus assembly protein protease CpaA